MTDATDSRTPGVSVVVITLNEEHNIRHCLESLVALDYPRDCLEILVVDASSDSTARIAAEYPLVRVLTSERGFAHQKNVGLGSVNHGIVAFTDADCITLPNWLRSAVAGLADPRVTGVGGNAFPPPDTGFFGRCVAAVGHPAGGSIGFDANVDPSRADGIEFIAGCNGAFRRSDLLAVGGFDRRFDGGGEDVDLSRRLRSAGGLLKYVPDMDVYHKPHIPFAAYVCWNIRVGVSKYALHRPGLLHLVLEPASPVWSLALIVGLAWLGFAYPGFIVPVLLAVWTAFLAILYAGARSYPLLLQRRQRAGLPLWAVATVVPFLVWVRQVAINIGQIGSWRRERRSRA
ncbi:MAG: glycosyltransferase [Coriobacteriia bacterium]|nr:glycosyltransferase [Coriobacteriia bacterium]